MRALANERGLEHRMSSALKRRHAAGASSIKIQHSPHCSPPPSTHTHTHTRPSVAAPSLSLWRAKLTHTYICHSYPMRGAVSGGRRLNSWPAILPVWPDWPDWLSPQGARPAACRADRRRLICEPDRQLICASEGLKKENRPTDRPGLSFVSSIRGKSS